MTCGCCCCVILTCCRGDTSSPSALTGRMTASKSTLSSPPLPPLVAMLGPAAAADDMAASVAWKVPCDDSARLCRRVLRGELLLVAVAPRADPAAGCLGDRAGRLLLG